jgi:hypothetical protein
MIELLAILVFANLIHHEDDVNKDEMGRELCPSHSEHFS